MLVQCWSSVEDDGPALNQHADHRFGSDIFKYEMQYMFQFLVCAIGYN